MARKEEEKRSDLVVGDITLNQDQLVQSLAEGVGKLPKGTHYFVNENGVLKPFVIPEGIHLDEIIERVVGIAREENWALIADAYCLPHRNARSTEMVLELGPTGKMTRAHYGDGMGDNPTLSATFQPDEESGVVMAEGRLFMPLVPQISALCPTYAGDEKVLKFSGIQGYSEKQVALVYRDGVVPDIDVSKYITEKLLGRKYYPRPKISTPELTFDPNEDSYQVGEGRAYLSWNGENKPKVWKGRTIRGVVLTEDRDEVPYGIEVCIKDIGEVPFEYANGWSKATQVTGEITLNNGVDEPKKVWREFLVYSGRKYLRNHPQELLGRAFVATQFKD